MALPVSQTLHATAVAVHGRALLIQGRSGRGKSGLALEMMARGASLVSDDQVIATRRGNEIWLTAPDPLNNLIEARGLGLLLADRVREARLAAVLDLDETETQRLPQNRDTRLLDISFPLLTYYSSPFFAAALVQFLKSGRKDVG